MKVGDNNVIESKGISHSVPLALLIPLLGMLWAPRSQGFLSPPLPGSVCWQERDPDKRLHHRGLLQRQHIRGDPGEHRHLRGRLPAARADRAPSGACVTQGTLPPSAPRGLLPHLPSLPFQPQTLQLDFLMKILPNYHHLKKTMKASSTPVKS